MALKALGDKIIVIPIQDEQVTATGLYLPDQALKTPTRGTVYSVGPDFPGDVNEGDVVLYGEWAGAKALHEGVEYFILDAVTVIAVLEGVA
jgi:chaperonin GroES